MVTSHTLPIVQNATPTGNTPDQHHSGFNSRRGSAQTIAGGMVGSLGPSYGEQQQRYAKCSPLPAVETIFLESFEHNYDVMGERSKGNSIFIRKSIKT